MKKYWKSIEETKPGYTPEPAEIYEKKEKGAILDLLEDKVTEAKASRRDFLKLCGYSFTLASLASSCERPIEKAIPYLIKPEVSTPGKASYYASSFYDGDDFSSIVVKVRDGRPIKIEGNKLCPIGGMGTTARVQASILGLYDQASFREPFVEGQSASWDTADAIVTEKLAEVANRKGRIVLLTPTIISPSQTDAIQQFLQKHQACEWIQYDSVSYCGILEANERVFNRRRIPFYRFDKAELILSFGADFLGTWLLPAEFSKQFAINRTLTDGQKTLSRLIQFESRLSITGATSDERVQIKPSQEKSILANIYNGLAEKLGGPVLNALPQDMDLSGYVAALLESRGKALVISGSNDPDVQVLVNGINYLLDSFSSTIDLDQPVLLKQGDDRRFSELIAEMEAGHIEALISYHVNPVHNHPLGERIAEAIGKVPVSISLSHVPDETSLLADYICPDHHYLESWGDAEPVEGVLCLSQPVIRPLGNTRQFSETLLLWAGMDQSADVHLRDLWEKHFFNRQNELLFNDFWNKCLQSGVFEMPLPGSGRLTMNSSALLAVSGLDALPEEVLELCVYEGIALGSGRQANNPWLQELPDPIAKISWDNFVSFSPQDASDLGIATADEIMLGGTLTLPAYVQPGQTRGVISVAMGYGRKTGGKVAEAVGGNAIPLLALKEGIRIYQGATTVTKTGGIHSLALSQTHHSMEGRALVRETTMDEYIDDPAAGNEMHKKIQKHLVTLYEEVAFDGVHWGMAIDLNKCTGCSSCVIGCQAENNIPVIGKKEVMNRRIMHWIRLDRYFSGDPANPKVHFQPVMCQHCDNAPCENVCPVAATNHSNEGINQMAYIRCIGTKYCINNCPYKVRRFNWFAYVNNQEFDYHMNNDLGKMVLNPDVTVRERGVVEKCSFCIQRIQEAKMNAKLENRTLKEGEVLPACAQACPSGAIVFGNLNDSGSEVAKRYKDPRNYFLLEELHTLPTVGYLTRVRNDKV
jgi:MoCo/4Fe-4S cofactor protein with predicted Tat translocation signal